MYVTHIQSLEILFFFQLVAQKNQLIENPNKLNRKVLFLHPSPSFHSLQSPTPTLPIPIPSHSLCFSLSFSLSSPHSPPKPNPNQTQPARMFPSNHEPHSSVWFRTGLYHSFASNNMKLACISTAPKHLSVPRSVPLKPQPQPQLLDVMYRISAPKTHSPECANPTIAKRLSSSFHAALCFPKKSIRSIRT